MLVAIERSTHCPLKGDTEYFDLEVGGRRHPASAWSYVHTRGGADVIRGLIAFDTSVVSISAAG